MTLIVARNFNGSIYIESDSRISDPTAVRSTPLKTLLKTVILDPFTCVSFAGVIDYADVAFEEVYKRRVDSTDSLLQLLLSSNKTSGNNTDYIVATSHNNTPRLFKVSSGRIFKDVEHAWIGDTSGFEVYQKAFLSQQDDKLQARMSRAFRTVIDNENLDTIGDFQISTSTNTAICPGQTVFLHTESVTIEISEPQKIQFDKKGQWKSIGLGSTKGGSHGLSYLVTVSPRFHGVAAHFMHGNFGVLFCLQINRLRPVLIRGVDRFEFVQEVLRRYGIPLRGFVRRGSDSIQLVDSRTPLSLSTPR